jgi:kynurenine formamidase
MAHAFDGDTVLAYGIRLQAGQRFKGMTDGNYYYEANTFGSAEHGGTHLDAPSRR